MTMLRCGHCGGDRFELDGHRDPPNDGYEAIVATCVECSSSTRISSSRPFLRADWMKDAKGILAPMGRRK